MSRKTLLLFALALAMLGAQTAGRFALTVDNIMRGPNLVGYEPSGVRWSGDSERIYFRWKQASEKRDAPFDTYVVNRNGSGMRKVTEEEARLAPPVGGDLSRDKKLTVYAQSGDIFLYQNAASKARQITKTAETESDPRFLRDGKRISFVRGNNLYVLSLEDGALVQITEITAAEQPAGRTAGRGGQGQGQSQDARDGAAGAQGEQRGTDSQEYLKKEEKELLQVIRQRAARREEDEARRKRENPRKPVALQPRQSVISLQLSPDEKFVTAVIAENAGTAKRTIVPNFVTESAYTEDIQGRANVGDTQAATRMALIDAATGEVKWVDHGIRYAPPAQTAAAAAPNQGQRAPEPQSQARQIALMQPIWSEDGARAVMAGWSADNKDWWLFALDPATGKLRTLASAHDDAWLDNPGEKAIGWMKNDREVYFESEKSGYSHLYAVPFDGGEPRALTSGEWEVLSVSQSRDKSKFFIVANKEGPFENHVYAMDPAGGPLTRLTEAPGKHSVALSPDERWFADIYSYTNKPPELYVQENRSRAESRKLTESPAPEFSQYAWQDAPIVMIPARDGVKVPARLYKPANFRAGGPAVVFIHGAGYLQNVDRWWSSSYYREYMFNHLLMERGFLVIDVDYRGSAGYGRDWRTAIYRHMGGKDLDDLVDAAKFIVQQYGVDPKKIGLYGGSYGGFLTLMGMFTQPDVFAAGAALRPVTDWAHYNHGYTSDILNLPQTDSEAYRKSSPIYFADGLKGALLICHGMVDTNVEFQDTVRLTQRLIELRKENWSVAMYPAEDHTFVESTSWADEYKRILKLFEQNLK